MSDTFNIFCMTWNSEAVRFCESYGLSRDYGAWTSIQCEDPRFIEILIDKIKNSSNNYDLVVFALQESPSPGDQLQSYLLPEVMKDKYTCIDRNKAMGVGVATVNKKTQRGLRISVYKRNDLKKEIKLIKKSYIFCQGKDQITGGKGGISLVIDVKNVGIFSFVDVHLPFNSHSLKNNDLSVRNQVLEYQNDCLLRIYDELVQKLGVDYTFLMGDLNYRVKYLDKNGNRNAQEAYDTLMKNGPKYMYDNYDELGEQLHLSPDEQQDRTKNKRTVLPPLMEGVNGEGPLFMPTCKMRKTTAKVKEKLNCVDPIRAFNRDTEKCSSDHVNSECYKMGCKNQRAPSWCDRILYMTNIPTNPHPIVCTHYDRWDAMKGMSLSDHAAVISSFTINL